MDDPLAQIDAKLAAAVGEVVRGCALGADGVLTVKFGEQGAFRLMIHQSAWRIETGTTVIASSQDDRASSEPLVRQLDGRTLTGIVVELPSLSATFAFSDSLRLKTFSVFTQEAEHWMLHLPDGETFTAGPGTQWTSGPRGSVGAGQAEGQDLEGA